MASSIPAPAPAELALAAMQKTRPRGRRMPWLMRLGLGVVALLAVLAVVAPWVVQDPERQSLRARLKPPTLEGADGRAHLLGTDHLGRDVLARVIFGSRVSLVVGISAVLVGGLIGSTLGLVPSFPTLVMVIGLSGWVSYARILRAQVLVLRSREFVEAIRGLGGSMLRIVLRHILPNVLASLVVVATLELARSIVLEATLSFLGLGIQPPTPSWGGMIQEGRDYLDSAWWISTCPGVVLMITSIVISRTGDWLRDVLDPTLRGE